MLIHNPRAKRMKKMCKWQFQIPEKAWTDGETHNLGGGIVMLSLAARGKRRLGVDRLGSGFGKIFIWCWEAEGLGSYCRAQGSKLTRDVGGFLHGEWQMINLKVASGLTSRVFSSSSNVLGCRLQDSSRTMWGRQSSRGTCHVGSNYTNNEL